MALLIFRFLKKKLQNVEEARARTSLLLKYKTCLILNIFSIYSTIYICYIYIIYTIIYTYILYKLVMNRSIYILYYSCIVDSFIKPRAYQLFAFV